MAPGRWDRAGQISFVEAFDQPPGDFEGATAPPCFVTEAQEHAPTANEVSLLGICLERQNTSLTADAEGVLVASLVSQRDGTLPCKRDDGVVRKGQPGRRVGRRGVRHHRNGYRSFETVVEESLESVTDTKELVRQPTGYCDLDTGLELAQKARKIVCHDC